MSRTIRRALPIALACAALLAACGSDVKTSSNAPGTTAAGTSTGGECAKADGSSPKTQQFTQGPPECLVKGKTYKATIVTTQGTLHVLLRADIAPNTVNSFVNLARFHYFDNTTCHRAIKGFVVQCGDPTATGSGGPGYTFANELDHIEPYRIGSVAMAHSLQPDSNGSQFFIITGDQGVNLPAEYTLFGQVDPDDMAVVTALDAVANPSDGPPLTPIDITSITIDES